MIGAVLFLLPFALFGAYCVGQVVADWRERNDPQTYVEAFDRIAKEEERRA